MNCLGEIADNETMAATKGIRLHAELRKQFEEFCKGHLLDERAVIEAWLLRFLESSEAEKQQVATRYREWMEEQSKQDVRRQKKKL